MSGDVDEGIFDSDLWMWKSVVALVLDYLPDLDLGREEERIMECDEGLTCDEDAKAEDQQQRKRGRAG